ncbi:hypothetical protein [Microbulbifer epialgicus]|uniref:Uncharacterized protein n=1 Tax=Microbulbifer epialgicus TaxID=393907 RepID=A0ABV4P5T5_9GAMM
MRGHRYPLFALRTVLGMGLVGLALLSQLPKGLALTQANVCPDRVHGNSKP